MGSYQGDGFQAAFDHVRGLESFLGFRADSSTQAFLKEETGFTNFPDSSPLTSIVLEYCEGGTCSIWMNGKSNNNSEFQDIVIEAKENLDLPSSPFINLASGRGEGRANARFESIAPDDAMVAIEQLLQTIHARGDLVLVLHEEGSNFIDQNATDAQVQGIAEGFRADILDARQRRDEMLAKLNSREGKQVYSVAHNAPQTI